MNTDTIYPGDPNHALGVEIAPEKAHQGTPLQGKVYKVNLGEYTVRVGDNMIPCTLSSRLRALEENDNLSPHSGRRGERKPKSKKHINPLVVGDRVRVISSGVGRGEIVERLPRRNHLARRSAVPMPGAYAREQVIAANLDLVYPTKKLPKTLLFRVTRGAEGEADPVADLLDDEGSSEPGSIIRQVSHELKARRFAGAVRLQYDSAMPKKFGK